VSISVRVTGVVNRRSGCHRYAWVAATVGYCRLQLAGGVPVGLEVVLAPEQVVIDPRDVRDRDV
jgi:hypothetical protein